MHSPQTTLIVLESLTNGIHTLFPCRERRLAPWKLTQPFVRRQEAILGKFGFFRHRQAAQGEAQYNYIHVTGNMIVLISSSGALRSRPKLLLERHRKFSASSRDLAPEASQVSPGLWRSPFTTLGAGRVSALATRRPMLPRSHERGKGCFDSCPAGARVETLNNQWGCR